MNMLLNNTRISKERLLKGDKALYISFNKRSILDKYLSKSFNNRTSSFITANHEDSLNEIDQKALVTQSVAMPGNMDLGSSMLDGMSFTESSFAASKIGSMAAN